MENIQIINTKEMNDWVQIVFDYDEKTFFYFKENLGDNENIYSETEIHYNNELVYSDKLVTIKKNQNETQKLEINKNIIAKELFLELQNRKLIYNDFLYDNAYDLGFDFFNYYSKKHNGVPNADLETMLKRKDSHKEELLFMIKQNNIYYFGNLKTETGEYIVKKLEITTCDKFKNKEFVLQLDFMTDKNLKNVYDIDFYYNEKLFTEDVEKIIFDYYQVDFDNKNIDMNKHQLSINSFKHDYKNLDIIFDDKTYLLRKIENFNGEKIKIFNQNYNLIYEKEYQPLKTIKKHENSEYITDKFKRMTKSNFMLRSKKIYYIFGD